MVALGSKKSSLQVSPGDAPEVVPVSVQMLTTKTSSKPNSPKSPRSGRSSHDQDVLQPKISQGLSLSSPRKTGPFASKSSPPLRPKKSSKSPSPSRGKSSSSRNSPQMDGVVSPPSSLNGKNSLDAETLRVFDPETMRIRQIVSGYGAENGSVEGPWDYEPGPPFTLTVAGVCDANDMYYFPLQEQIAYLESKLIDLAMRYNNLEDEHRVVRQSHEHLNRTVREANLVARDQVVFENLKLKYQLAATELEDARKLIRELRQLGWENLPQRMLYECKKTHDEMFWNNKEVYYRSLLLKRRELLLSLAMLYLFSH
ncbi:unnamed protein product [Dicrocoelium dendriticum]|nr:unnamed protein product [Dicrocoelium dendriticum]